MGTLVVELNGAVAEVAISTTTSVRSTIAVPITGGPTETSVKGVIAARIVQVVGLDAAVIGTITARLASLDGVISDSSGWVKSSKLPDDWTLVNRLED